MKMQAPELRRLPLAAGAVSVVIAFACVGVGISHHTGVRGAIGFVGSVVFTIVAVKCFQSRSADRR